ncbi:MAG: aconitate hydratase AcnA [Thermoplasmataceae archaeon]|jgi:aconitate hydratase
MESKYRILKKFKIGAKEYNYYSIKDLENFGHKISELPISIRVILESLIRNLDGKSVHEKDIENLLNWNPKSPSDSEIPFKVSRVVMQDFTGVPAVVDLAAMRDAAVSLGKKPDIIQPQVPVDLVIDHSVQVDFFANDEALEKNMEIEFERNSERYRFLKWAQTSFNNLRIVPPSVGIIHQVNLEYLAKVVMTREIDGKTFAFPDSLVGTDSHTTMIGGVGIIGWGVGGIEAEAAMLDQPVTFKTPEVVGVKLKGKLRTGVTATDLVLTLTELLRKNKVVGKFIEFFGEGVPTLSIPDRATLSNMCPEYGATLAVFPVDEMSLQYLEMTGRTKEHIDLIKEYLEKQGLFGSQENVHYSQVIELDLSSVRPSVSGPKLPQQRVDLGKIGDNFLSFMEESGRSPQTSGSRQKEVLLKSVRVNVKGKETDLTEGDVVIAAITSCTNTSNPNVMMAAGLLAKKAVEKGLTVSDKVKTSLAPGSRVVSEYLSKSGLQKYLDKLGFNIVGFGCTTCIGNSGPLDADIEKAIVDNNLSTAAVLSGNRNFEARIHRNVRANYLMSPPLVVAFAIAGKVTVDLDSEPLGITPKGEKVFLKDIWPTEAEVQKYMKEYLSESMFKEKYRDVNSYNKKWAELEAPSGMVYKWEEKSTYIRKPPFFEGFNPEEEKEFSDIKKAYPLLVLGDAITTDHISPAGGIGKDTPAARYLMDHGVKPVDFNSYGARRGNHEVMMRGTFSNNRIKNKLVDREGGYTVHYPDGTQMPVYDAAMKYVSEKTQLLVLAGDLYGSGSSRDWAAKGTMLLGIRAVIAVGYERIHRSNLVGMGVLPLQFKEGENAEKLEVDPAKPMDVSFPDGVIPGGKAVLKYSKKGHSDQASANLTIRIDTPVELEYMKAGGILQYVMKRLSGN